MPLFGISGKSLTPINPLSFPSERAIQKITEQNLQVIFGFKFVSSEFSSGHFRLDTIALDEESNSFVIIEYKRDQNFSVIDQGCAYLSMMLNNKADFVLAYNENTVSYLKKEDFDWSQSKVIFVAPSFTPYQIEAINFKDLPIELWEIHLYSNETVGYNKIKSQQATASVGTIAKASKALKNVGAEIKVYSEEELLDGVEDETREAYMVIKEMVYQVNPDVEERIKKTMVCFYAGGKGLIWVKPTKKNITVWLRKGNYKDRDGKIIQNGWGNYPELHLASNEIDTIFIRKLIERANNIQK